MRIVYPIVSVVTVLTIASLTLAQSQQPATPPATQPGEAVAEAMEPTIAPDAQPIIDDVRQAYTKLNAVELAGTVSRQIDVAQKQDTGEEKFTASFQEPNLFRHQVGDKLTVGSTGEKVYAHNKVDNSYLIDDAPEPDAPLTSLPRPIPEILQTQNPSLLLAIERDPLKQLGPVRIDKSPDVIIDGQRYVALKIAGARSPETTLIIDPQTHLIRRIVTDMTSAMREAGLQDVKLANATIDYTEVNTNASFEPGHFAWTPPEGARDIRAMIEQQQVEPGAAGAAPGEAQLAAGEGARAQALVGQQAPEFALQTLQGEKFSLSDAKGDLVLLDFWATWCPPCVESLPHLGKLYAQRGDDVRIYAVNLQEDKDKVQTFLGRHNIDIPVLLDTTGAVAKQYGVSSIPQTVLIDHSGTVRRVWLGFGPDSFAEIQQAVEELRMPDGDAPPKTKQDN